MKQQVKTNLWIQVINELKMDIRLHANIQS